MRLVLAALAILSSAAFAAEGPQWKWRDASGQLHASDLPPPAGVPEQNILQRPSLQQRSRAPVPAPAAASAPAAKASGVDAELEARRRRASEQQVEQQRAQAAQDASVRAENCSRARAYLQALTDGARLTRTNAQGEREVLDDQQRASEIQRTRAVIASDCR
ncbi:MAG TPA: DUF4124 domain-containing protein [Burkholderiaceae bacterium]|nr:DUF4124 domain-containing protein [Burkholderiaceae bacterium]